MIASVGLLLLIMKFPSFASSNDLVISQTAQGCSLGLQPRIHVTRLDFGYKVVWAFGFVKASVFTARSDSRHYFLF